MKAFALILSAILLPFAAIGAFTAASLLRMQQGIAAGLLPTLLTVAGGILIIVFALCILQLQKLHVAKRRTPPDAGD